MMWQALSRAVTVRLVLLVAIVSTGPVAGAASWHTLDSQEHRLGVASASDAGATIAAGALPYARGGHCAACAFGATLRAWSPAAAPLAFVPLDEGTCIGQPSPAPLRSATAWSTADRAPPRLA